MSTGAPPPSQALRDMLEDLQPVQTRRPVRDWLLGAALSAAAAAALVLLTGIRRDLAGLPTVWLAVFVVWWTAGFAGVLHLAFVPRPGQVSPRARFAAALGIGFGVIAVGLGLAFVAAASNSTIVPEGIAPFFRYGRPCYLIGMTTAIAPAVITFWYLRGAAPMNTRWLAAGIGAASGALGGLVLTMHCPVVNASHVGLVHGLIPLLAAGAAALAAGLLMRR